MDSARVQLARRVLEPWRWVMLLSFDDAIQLLNWAVRPEDSVRPLAEIARAILDREQNRKAKATKGGR